MALWFFVCVWQSNEDIKRKQVDTSCVKQSDTPVASMVQLVTSKLFDVET